MTGKRALFLLALFLLALCLSFASCGGEDPGTPDLPVPVPPEEEKAFSGLPAGWNFYARGYTASTCSRLQETEAAKNWNLQAAAAGGYRVHATSGNTEAYLTASATKGSVGNLRLSPSIQVLGLLEGDAFVFVIPVSGFRTGTRIRVSGATGGAAASVGYWLPEYSEDATDWHTAPDAQTITANGQRFSAHFWNTDVSMDASTRTAYFGEKDDSYHSYTFPCDGISTINDGNLYRCILAADRLFRRRDLRQHLLHHQQPLRLCRIRILPGRLRILRPAESLVCQSSPVYHFPSHSRWP